MSDDQNFPPPPSPMPSPNASPNPAPSPSPMPAPSPAPEQSFGQFAPPTMPAGGATPPPTYTAPQPTGGGGGGKKNGLILGIVAAVVAVGVAAFILLSGKDDDKSAGNSPSISIPDSGDMDNSSDETQAPDDNGSDSGGGSSAGSAGYSVGEMADVEGGVMRVNSVETNSGYIDQYSPPADGTSYTRVEVETCAISDNVDAGYIEWDALLDDGSLAELTYTNSEAPMLTLVPGDCARGYVVYIVPDGSELATISHTDFWTDEQLVWDLTSDPVAIDGPMPANSGPGNDIGSSFTFDSGIEVTVLDAGNYESTDEYYELPQGRRLVAANVRVCSETTTTVFASDFYVFTDDNFVATIEYYNSSFVTSDLNPGDCAEGGVVFLIPEGSDPSMIMFKEFGTGEFARWTP